MFGFSDLHQWEELGDRIEKRFVILLTPPTIGLSSDSRKGYAPEEFSDLGDGFEGGYARPRHLWAGNHSVPNKLVLSQTQAGLE
jgi:hypothetical protein